MTIKLQYGRAGLALEPPPGPVRVIEPTFVPGLADERAAFEAAVRAPIGAPPLRALVGPRERVVIVIPDLTRPLPSDRLLPWLLAELPTTSLDRITILNGTGSHRGNTRQELARMVGPEVLARVRVVNHDAYDRAGLRVAGKTRDGRDVLLAREYVEADRRIVLGFIEPHFMAGFSGGYKGVFPGVAGIDSILHYHRAAAIADPRSTWGVLDGNPTQEQIRWNGGLLPVDLLVNVTLNRRREITGFFCGDVSAAHAEGCAFARATAMAACERRYPIVVTTNAGYPLDQNLYQAVKGMSAALQILEPGGLILAAAECSDGFPSHGNFRKLVFEHDGPRALLDTILAPGFSLYEQWQAQIFALVLLEARVGLTSALDPDEVRRAYLEPVPDIGARIAAERARLGSDAAVAILPEGPMTIPYVA